MVENGPDEGQIEEGGHQVNEAEVDDQHVDRLGAKEGRGEDDPDDEEVGEGEQGGHRADHLMN
ncbi:hypothetical protein TYRP_009692 [Tyrophagus putrescentiae]|nr:hypothetical protein TYRP_009692 [Tyrophagus putrescentiae]